MRCSSRPTRASKIGTGRRRVQAVAVAFVLALPPASRRLPRPTIADPPSTPTPTPTPSPTPTVTNSYGSAGAAVTNLGSSFLERFGNQASSGFGSAHAAKPGRRRRLGSAEPPRYRSWAEAYGISARTGAQGDFVGDRRRTCGGVAGDRRARCARRQCRRFSRPKPHRNRRSARAAIGNPRSHPDSASTPRWTRAHGPGRIALVHGFGKINTSRDTGFGLRQRRL